MKKYKYSRKKIEKELVDWKENSGSNKRFNGILMRLLSTLPQEEKKEWIRCEKCEVCRYLNFIDWAQSVGKPEGSTIEYNRKIDEYLKLKTISEKHNYILSNNL